MVKEQQSIPMQQIDSNAAARKNLDDILNRLSDLQNHSTQAEAISTKAVNMMDDLTENVVDSIKVRLALCPYGIEDPEYILFLVWACVTRSNSSKTIANVNVCCIVQQTLTLAIIFILLDLKLCAWVKVFRIISEFRILRLTFHRKSASKCWIWQISVASFGLTSVYLKIIDL